MRATLVSIVIPCHGHAAYLADAIESALGQTHEAVEVVVVDDGSPDDAAAVAASYPSVRLIRQARAGLAAARNAGLAASSGALVAFLDADDRLLPDGIAAGVAVLDGHPEAALAAGAHAVVDADGRLVEVRRIDLAARDAYLALLAGNIIGMHGAVLYRRAALVASGAFDPSLAACEDYDLYLRLARTSPVRTHDAVVAEYRRHAGNMSNDTSLMLREVHRVLHRQLPHVEADRERLVAFRRGQWSWTSYYLDAGGPVTRAPGTGQRSLRRRVVRALVRRARGLLVPGRRGSTPKVGSVAFGDLRRLRPLSADFGYERGRPVDRHYIEAFLERHGEDVRGRVLEAGGPDYTRRFGGDRVEQEDVLHVAAGNPQATFVGTLEDGAGLPSAAFDCVILTQVLHLIFDVPAALRTVERILKPGGVLLATVPGISQVANDQWGATWSWAILPHGLSRLVEDAFPGAEAVVRAHGNVLTSAAFLYGLADRELTPAELDHHDPAYPMLVTARVVKAATTS